MKTSSAERGFSLLEILIALGILSMVAGVAFASLKPVREADAIDAGARSLALWLEHERGASLRQRLPRRVRLLPRGAQRGDGDGDVFETDGLAAAPAPIVFYPDGETSGARITLGSGATAVAVAVDALTGRIEVLHGKVLAR